MKDPKIKTTVIHSYSNKAWNVVCTELGKKYKVARIPYLSVGNEESDSKLKQEAFHHALFISQCFNNSKEVSQLLVNNPKNPKTSKKMYIYIKNHTIWN